MIPHIKEIVFITGEARVSPEVLCVVYVDDVLNVSLSLFSHCLTNERPSSCGLCLTLIYKHSEILKLNFTSGWPCKFD